MKDFLLYLLTGKHRYRKPEIIGRGDTPVPIRGSMPVSPSEAAKVLAKAPRKKSKAPSKFEETTAALRGVSA